jgi:hypothetical protein
LLRSSLLVACLCACVRYQLTEHRQTGCERVIAEGVVAGFQGIMMMTLDVTEEAQGRFHIWGKTMEGEVVLMRVTDFLPYFYIAAPLLQVT